MDAVVLYDTCEQTVQLEPRDNFNFLQKVEKRQL